MTRRCPATLDLLAWEPGEVVSTFAADQVKAPTLRDRIAKAVALTLTGSDIPRERIASEMSAWMGEKIPVSMLDAYASQAKKDHTISANRLAALCAVTGDTRALQLLAESVGGVIVPDRFLAAIRYAEVADKIQQLENLKVSALREWKS